MVPIAELRQAAKAVGFRIGDAWNFGHNTAFASTPHTHLASLSL